MIVCGECGGRIQTARCIRVWGLDLWLCSTDCRDRWAATTTWRDSYWQSTPEATAGPPTTEGEP